MIKMIKYNLEETYTKKDVVKWKIESRMWTKNIMRVKTGQDFKELIWSSREWSNRLRDWVNDELVGSNRRHRDLEIPKELKDGLRDTFFKFTNYVNSEFLNVFSSNSKFRGENEYYFVQNHGLPEYSSESIYTPEMWNDMYTIFEPRRAYTYSRYQKLAKKAFNALDNFFDTLEDLGNKEIFSAMTTDRFKVLGINVIVKDSEERPSSKLKNLKPNLAKGLEVLFNLGFKKWIERITICFNLNDSGSAAGTWNQSDQLLSLYGSSFYGREKDFLGVLYHEFGHLYFKNVLSQNRIDIWNEFRYSKKNQLVVSRQDQQEIKEILEKMGYFEERTNKSCIKKGRILDNLASEISDVRLKIKVIALLAGEVLYSFTDIDTLEGKSVWAGVVSDYSISKKEEDFPEVFSKYVNGYPIPDVVEEVLRLIIPELRIGRR